MSITLVGRPKNGDELNPTYNPIVYYFDSSNNNEPGFRYVAQIKDEAGALLFEKVIVPDPTTGFCNLHINRELQDYVSFDMKEQGGFPQHAENSYIRFDIEMGEEYQAEWAYDGLIYLDDATAYWPNAGDPQYNPPNPFLNKQALTTTSLSTAPPYSSGDWIFVNQLDPTILPAVSGYHRVLDVFNAGGSSGFYWTVVLDLTYQGGGTTSGTVRYADNRKTRFLNEYSLVDQVAFNGVLSPQDWLDWNENDYVMTKGRIGKWLTTAPNPYRVREDNTILINFYKRLADLISDSPAKFYLQNDSGDIARITSFQLTHAIRQLDISPTRATFGSILIGTFPIVKPTTEWFEITATDNLDIQVSQTHRFEIDRSCTTGYEDIEMQFMDKLGSMMPFNFTLRNIEQRQIDKENYVKYLGGIQYREGLEYYGYDLRDGGKVTYDESFVRVYTLRTPFLNDEYSRYFTEVIESPVTSIKIDGEFHRCVITTSSYEVKKERWYEMKRYEIEVMLSNRNKVNI